MGARHKHKTQDDILINQLEQNRNILQSKLFGQNPRRIEIVHDGRTVTVSEFIMPPSPLRDDYFAALKQLNREIKQLKEERRTRKAVARKRRTIERQKLKARRSSRAAAMYERNSSVASPPKSPYPYHIGNSIRALHG